MASYSVLASETTTQVISPKLTLPIEETTIQTQPSGVIATMALAKADFDAGTAGTLLGFYADNIEQLMRLPHVIAGQGSQTLDPNGLLADNVVFTVEYVPSGVNVSRVTAEAVVPTGLLTEGGDPTFERVLMAQAEAIIQRTYDNLVAMAGG